MDHASDTQYRAIFENMREIFFVCEIIYDAAGTPRDFRYLDANPACVRWAARAADALLGHTYLELFPPGPTFATWLAHLDPVARAAAPDHFELVDGAGGQVFEVFATALQPGQCAVIANDITERKQAEEKLRLSENQFQALFEQMLNGFAYCQMLYDPAGVPQDFIYLKVNRAFEKQTGLMQVTGKKVSEVIPGIATTDRALLEIYGRVARTGTPETFERYVEALKMWFSVSVYCPQSGYFVAIFDVITERKRAEEQIARLLERFNLATHAASMGVWDWDMLNNQLLWDDTMYALYGIHRDTEIFGAYEAWLNGLHPEDRAANNEISLQAQRGEIEYDTEFRVVWPDGSIHWLKADGLVIRDAAGRPLRMVGVNYDITDKKSAENEIRQLNATLEQRVRERTAQLESANKELESFAYSVSHDLRAPLRGIDGWSLALAEDYADQLDEKACQYIHLVRSETQRMGQLIDDLLRLSRLSLSEMMVGWVDLSAKARAIAERLQAAQPERQVECIIQPGLATQGDARLLEIMLTNLLSNAYKFTGKQPQARIELGQLTLEGKPTYFIRDNGVGFNMAYAKNLFGAFQRLHRQSEFPGTGIGLATAQRIIHRHGGSIWAEARPNAGATFYFTLKELG